MTASGDTELTLLLGGDVHAGTGRPSVCAALRRIAGDADVTIFNVESPLTRCEQFAVTKSTKLRTAPDNIDVLRQLSLDVASLANNHMCDCGSDGIADTRRVLADAGIAAVGAGGDLAEAILPAIIERGGVSLGVLAFGSGRIETVAATADHYGCAPLERSAMIDAVGELSTRVDVVLVSVHWGYTNYHYPLPEHVQLGRALVDAGATVVAGHHPHVIQGFERRGIGIIVYSLGNFMFARFNRDGKPAPQSRENRMSLLARIKVSKGGVLGEEFFHTEQVDPEGAVRLITGRAAGRRDKFLSRLSKPLGRSSYERFFRKYVLRRLAMRAIWFADPRRWRAIAQAAPRGLQSAKGLLGRS